MSKESRVQGSVSQVHGKITIKTIRKSHNTAAGPNHWLNNLFSTKENKIPMSKNLLYGLCKRHDL